MGLELLIEVTIKSTLFWDVMFTDVLEDHAVSMFSAEERALEALTLAYIHTSLHCLSPSCTTGC